MRIGLTLDHMGGEAIPINYQYLISSWIYKMIHKSDSEFAEWLHEEGYTIEGKKFKHFCFGMLQPRRYEIKRDKFILSQSPTRLQLSFNVEEGAKHLIKGVFKDNAMQLRANGTGALMMIKEVRILPDVKLTEIARYSTTTPICISVGEVGKEHAQYLSPDDDRYSAAFASNLVNKANAFYNTDKYDESEVHFKLLSDTPSSKLWSIKNIKVKGFEYDFELTAPVELQKVGYNAGFGIANSSLGMGMCRVEAKFLE